MDPAKYAELFATEARDHLAALGQALLELEQAPGEREPLDAIFRAVHTVKGMSGIMGYTAVGTLAHAMESLLARVRAGEETLDGEMVTLLFDASDALEAVIAAATTAGNSALDVSSLVARLSSDRPEAPPAPSLTVLPPGAGVAVHVAFEDGTILPGARAQLTIARIASLGTVQAVAPDEGIRMSSSFDGAFSLRLETTSTDEEIATAVRAGGFVRDVRVERRAPVDPAVAEAGDRFDAAWGMEGLKAPLQQFVRIDLRRLDRLMNLVGELMIVRGRLVQLAATHEDRLLDDAVAETARLIGEVQDGVLGGRMVPVWQVFDRFPRVVRDAARTLGKDVEFAVQGREIELDRALLEQIADPLVHLLRNAIDHGIETPEARTEGGKRPTGRLTLSASRERSAVVIRISDDGRGVDRDKVLIRAKESGLLDPERQSLTDDEILRLIARPGFSTAERVTQLSGRGVGIDAVISRVRALGGMVDLRSTPGEGTSFTLRLPVTLAIIPALMARVADETYALPLTHVTETLQLTPFVESWQVKSSELQKLIFHEGLRSVRGREVIVLRNEVLPLLYLRDVVRLPRQNEEGSHVVVVEMADRRAGLVVDRLLGQEEIVVKSFDAARGTHACFSGATILGDGAAALILEVSSLLQESA